MDSLRDNTMRLSVGSGTSVKTPNKVARTSCKHCGKRYSYDPEELEGRTLRYRCRQCGGTNLLPGAKTASRPKTAPDTGKTPGSGEVRDSIDARTFSKKAVFRDAWTSFSKNWGHLAGIGLIFLGQLQLFHALLAVWQGRTEGISSHESAVSQSWGLPTFILLFLLFVSACWTHGAVFQWLCDQRICISEAYRRAFRKLGGWVCLVCMYGFIVLGGFVLLGIPALVFSVLFAFSFFIFAEKESTVTGSIMDSLECVSQKPIAAGVSLWVVWLPSIIASAAFGLLSAFAVLPFVAFYMHALYGRLRDSRPVPFREKLVERRPEPWQCIAILGFASFAIFINQYDPNPIGHVLRSLSVGM